MSDHQPEPESAPDGDAPPAEADREPSQAAAADGLELDFSLLRMARASLDRAFPVS